MIRLPTLAGLLLLLVALGAVGVFVWVGAAAGRPGDAAAIKRRAYRIRVGWFAVLSAVAIGVLSVVVSGYLPYPGFGYRLAPSVRTVADPANPLVVDVTGKQWAWEIERRALPAHRPITFRVTAADVNHGFGVYRDGALLAQVQAMPGVVNELTLQFEKPGAYSILCLEYCGTPHSGMRDRITVVEK